MIVIEFDNFKTFAIENNKRIYYFKVDNIIELYYLIGSVFVKSFVDIDKITDKEVFFGDKLFYGATKLLLNISSPSDNIGPHETNVTPISIIDLSKTKEGENKDIQEDGVI